MASSRIRTSLATLAAAALLVTAGCGVDQNDNATEKVTSNTETSTKDDGGGGKVEIESGSFEGTGGAVFLNQAAEATTAVETQKMTMEMTMTGVPDMGTMSMTMDGEIDNASGLSRISMDMSSMFGAMGTEEGMPADAGIMEMIVDGDTTYMKSSLFGMFGDDSKPWMKIPTADQDSLTSGAPSDPNQFLDFLKNSGSDVEELGTEEVRGVETTHVRTVLDMEDIMANASAEEQAEMQEQLDSMGSSLPEIPVEAWVDADGMIRRFTMTFDASSLGEDELDGMSMEFTIEMYDFGEPVDIQIPDPSQVSDLDTSMMMPGN
ncbi:MAG: hypothetical protein ABI239_01845 [Aquihabitans sp.]